MSDGWRYVEAPPELVAEMRGTHLWAGGFRLSAERFEMGAGERQLPVAALQPRAAKHADRDRLMERFKDLPALGKLVMMAFEQNTTNAGINYDDFLVGEHWTANPREWRKGLLLGDNGKRMVIDTKGDLYQNSSDCTVMPIGSNDLESAEKWATSVLQPEE